MMKILDQNIYGELKHKLLALFKCNYELSQSSFNKNIQLTYNDWLGGQINSLNVARKLSDINQLETSNDTHDIIQTLSHHRDQLFWEQSYTSSDNLVGQDMLDNYGFVEFIGAHGPYKSDKLRAGIGIWGPNINYPIHQHKAEEIYLPLAGHANFIVEDKTFTSSLNKPVLIKSQTKHGFKTKSQIFIVGYLWQSGDLRQKSTFFQ